MLAFFRRLKAISLFLTGLGILVWLLPIFQIIKFQDNSDPIVLSLQKVDAWDRKVCSKEDVLCVTSDPAFSSEVPEGFRVIRTGSHQFLLADHFELLFPDFGEESDQGFLAKGKVKNRKILIGALTSIHQEHTGTRSWVTRRNAGRRLTSLLRGVGHKTPAIIYLDTDSSLTSFVPAMFLNYARLAPRNIISNCLFGPFCSGYFTRNAKL